MHYTQLHSSEWQHNDSKKTNIEQGKFILQNDSMMTFRKILFIRMTFCSITLTIITFSSITIIRTTFSQTVIKWWNYRTILHVLTVTLGWVLFCRKSWHFFSQPLAVFAIWCYKTFSGRNLLMCFTQGTLTEGEGSVRLSSFH